MSIALIEKKSVITTGHPILDAELSLMTFVELDYLGKYLRIMREMGKNFDDGYSWADAPLTTKEEDALRHGRRNAKNGDYLTLEEFMKGFDDEESDPE